MRKKILMKILKKNKEVYLGDIALCYEIINARSDKGKNSLTKFKSEFNKLWIHGLVHLFGYQS